MMNTITLPDNISFGELAAKWLEKEWRMVERRCVIHSFYTVKLKDASCSALHYKRVAEYGSKSRGMWIEDDEAFSDILNFIKERSNV